MLFDSTLCAGETVNVTQLSLRFIQLFMEEFLKERCAAPAQLQFEAAHERLFKPLWVMSVNLIRIFTARKLAVIY